MPLEDIGEDELVDRVTDWVKANNQGSGEVEITADSDLLQSGLLDSAGFIELIVYLETQVGHPIDLAAAGIHDISGLKGLCRFVLRYRERGETECP